MKDRKTRRDGRRLNTNPLRKIVGYEEVSIGDDGEFEYFARHEKLECGHTVRQKEDIYGPTNAQKRRCRECGELNKEKK